MFIRPKLAISGVYEYDSFVLLSYAGGGLGVTVLQGSYK